MTTDYQKDDILERIATGQRVKILRVEGTKIRAVNVTDHIKRDYSQDTFRKHFANLTAQEQGRYKVTRWDPPRTRCSA